MGDEVRGIIDGDERRGRGVKGEKRDGIMEVVVRWGEG